jgi:FkbM family methyltransferase
MSLLRTLGFIARHPLNRGREARALVRFFKWQVGSRLVPGGVVYDWIEGAKLIVRPGETGLTGNIYCGLHELEEMAYLLHALGPEDVFVDVGANVGSYTILACAVKGARGVAFEPVPATFSRLRENLRVNDLDARVEAHNIGLSGEEGELAFTAGENCTNHVIADGEAEADVVRVKVRTLDAALEGQSPSMIKIDVEGFETRVIDGAREALRRESLHSVIMELNGSGARYGFDEGRILGAMREFGFSTYTYEPFSRELRPLGGKNNQSGNTLFIRGEEAVREKIRRSPPILVGGVTL